MSRFAYQSDSPNYPRPGKRPQHNMAPVVVLRRGKPYAGLGLPGGRFIVTVTAQLVASLIDFKATPRAAVSAPRIHTEGQEPILVTTNTPKQVVDELKRRGHRVDVRESLGGDANVAVIDPASSDVQAAASPGSTGVLMFNRRNISMPPNSSTEY
jgi:gamma-glutamyltranspeptidase/glutathione hydrolase